jgi:hypothetical protein
VDLDLRVALERTGLPVCRTSLTGLRRSSAGDDRCDPRILAHSCVRPDLRQHNPSTAKFLIIWFSPAESKSFFSNALLSLAVLADCNLTWK